MRCCIVLFLFFLLSHLRTFGQGNDSFIPKSSLTQFRETPDATWVNSSLNNYGYDRKNNRNVLESMVWHTTTWKLRDQVQTKYDNKSRITDESTKYFNFETSVLEYEQISKFEWGEEFLQKSQYEYINYNEKEASNRSETNFNDQGQRIRSYYLYQYKEQINEWEALFYYTPDGCILGYSQKYRDEFNDWLVTDSTANIYSSSNGIECDQRGVERYVVDYSTGKLRLEYAERFNKQYDSQNNLVSIVVEYQSFYNPEWVKQYESTYEYNSDGQVVYEEFSSFFEDELTNAFRTFIEYDSEGRVIFRETEYKLPEDTEWQKESTWSSEYDLEGNLLVTDYKGGYDSEYGDYTYQYAAKSEYNASNFITKSLVSSEYYDPFTNELYEESTEQVNNYRCDNAILSSQNSILASNIPVLEGNQYKTEYEYYTSAGCAVSEGEAFTMNIFPNPTNDYVHIQLRDPQDGNVQVIDNSGKVIFSQPFEESSYLSMDLSAYLSGSYLVQIETETGVEAKRMVLIK